MYISLLTSKIFSLLTSKIEAKQSALCDDTQFKPLIGKDFTLLCLFLLTFGDSYGFDSISDLVYPCLNTCIHIYTNVKYRTFLS